MSDLELGTRMYPRVHSRDDHPTTRRKKCALLIPEGIYIIRVNMLAPPSADHTSGRNDQIHDDGIADTRPGS